MNINLILNDFFNTNLGKFLRYKQLNSAITDFSQHACLLSSSNRDIIPMAYHPSMFILKYFLNRFVMLRFNSVNFIKNIYITITQILFPRDTNIFQAGTIFYRHYKGLHQMQKDLVVCDPKNCNLIK